MTLRWWIFPLIWPATVENVCLHATFRIFKEDAQKMWSGIGTFVMMMEQMIRMDTTMSYSLNSCVNPFLLKYTYMFSAHTRCSQVLPNLMIVMMMMMILWWFSFFSSLPSLLMFFSAVHVLVVDVFVSSWNMMAPFRGGSLLYTNNIYFRRLTKGAKQLLRQLKWQDNNSPIRFSLSKCTKSTHASSVHHHLICHPLVKYSFVLLVYALILDWITVYEMVLYLFSIYLFMYAEHLYAASNQMLLQSIHVSQQAFV